MRNRTDLKANFTEFVVADPDETDAALAKRFIHELSDAEILDLALSNLTTWALQIRRDEVRRIEYSSQRVQNEQRASEQKERVGARIASIRDNKRHVLEDVASRIQNVTLELTSELLESKFKVGRNNEVTWGEATIEQHTTKHDELIRFSSSTIQNALRHQEAISLIEEGGVACLNELI